MLPPCSTKAIMHRNVKTTLTIPFKFSIGHAPA